MERGQWFARVACASAAFGVMASSAVAQVVVPVHEEPRHHLVLDRDDLRILDVQIATGDTTLFHTHSTPIHYVSIGSSRTTSRALGDEWPEVGAPSGGGMIPVGAGFWNLDYADEPLTHQVANIGEGLFRLIAVVHGGGGDDDDPPSATGAREAESRWFVRERLDLDPGGSIRISAKRGPAVLIQVTSGGARLEDGQTASATSAGPGSWLVIESGTDVRLVNDRNRPVTFVYVLVRDA